MERPSMDRPREVKGTARSREMKRLLKAGFLITAIVLVVGSLPVVFLWFWADEIPAPGTGLAYGVEEVVFRSGDDEIAGRLWLPAFGGPHPAMVVAHGSGRAMRSNHEQIGSELATNGYALLSYDKRGVGDSGGDYSQVGTANGEEMIGLLASDVLAGVAHLLSRDDIARDRIGVYGTSQGGWIAPLAAARSPDVAFMVIVSGPTVSIGREIYYSDLTDKREGVALELSDAELSGRLLEYDGPAGFDPLPSLESVEIPSLWVLGEQDRSIPIPETVSILDRLIESGKPFTVRRLPDVGHGMRDLRTGQGVPLLPIVYGWLVENVGSIAR